MDSKSTNPTARMARRPEWRGGFSFTEVLFAVMLLGIGFIMVAALFPAAISQTQVALDEAEGSSVCTNGINYLKNVGATYNGPSRIQAVVVTPQYTGSWQFPKTPNNGLEFVAINTPTWASPSSSMAYPAAGGSPFINSADPRFGWIPFYRRSAGDPFAQVIVVAVQNQNQTLSPTLPALPGDTFTLGNPLALPPVLAVLPVVPGATLSMQFQGGNYVRAMLSAELDYNFQGDGTSLARITYPSAQAPSGTSVPWAAPGAFLIVASEPNPPSGVALLNGRIFRLGQQLTNLNFATLGLSSRVATGESDFQLIPGFDLKPDGSENRTFTNNQQVSVFVIGRPAIPPNTPNNPTTGAYIGSSTGLAQDVAVQTALIRVK